MKSDRREALGECIHDEIQGSFWSSPVYTGIFTYASSKTWIPPLECRWRPRTPPSGRLVGQNRGVGLLATSSNNNTDEWTPEPTLSGWRLLPSQLSPISYDQSEKKSRAMEWKNSLFVGTNFFSKADFASGVSFSTYQSRQSWFLPDRTLMISVKTPIKQM